MNHDLLFTYDFPPMGGGIARLMQSLATEHPPGTLVVSTGTLPGWAAVDTHMPNRVDRVGIHSDRLRTVGGLLSWSRRAIQLARDPETRFAWCDGLRPSAYPARWANARTGLPYGIMYYGSELRSHRARIEGSRLKRRILLPMLDGASVHLAISRWTAEQCRMLFRDLGLDRAAERVRVVPLGTDPLMWQPDHVGAEAFRQRRGLPAGRWLVTVARLQAFKGIDTGIGVLAALAKEFPDLQYAVVGRGDHAAALRALAMEQGLQHRVHFLDDVGDAELPLAYAMGEVYLGLTRELGIDIEGFGLSLLEASATELPVVACRSGGIPDAVEDGVTGLLVDQHDPAAAAAAVRHLLQNPAQARRMGRAGRERVLNGFNWSRVVAEVRGMAEEFGRRDRRQSGTQQTS